MLFDWLTRGIVATALDNRDLAHAVARHKSMFFVEKAADGGFVDYQAAVSGKLGLAPMGDARAALAADYGQMVDDGLLLEDAEPFEALIERCTDVAGRGNRATDVRARLKR
jgi:hypothetical protein